MDRWACVDVTACPLQLLLRDHPEWVRLPAAVVKADTPQALVQFVNARAASLGVRPGQRYATALALARDLQAGTMSASAIDGHVRDLIDRLRHYSPHVEPSAERPGVFWLDAQGLNRLYPSLHDWAQAVRLEMQRAGLRATVAVGFTRFGVYALAQCHQGITVCAEPGEERAAVERVPLSRVDLDPDAQVRLATLGIETVGAFLRLPGDGIRQRFGDRAYALYQLASGHRWAPLAPVPAETPQEQCIDFDAPEQNTERLIFIVKRLLDALLAAIVAESHAVLELALWMKLDDRATRTERIRPAASTLDAAQLLSLVRLRLEALRLSSGIVTLRISAATCPASSEQCRLFPQHGRRDPALANRAFARLRAELGERAVVRARIGNAHLPASQFEWEPFEQMPLRGSPKVVTARPLVRRIYTSPREVQARELGIRNSKLGINSSFPIPNSQLENSPCGPFVISGAWWGGGVRRDYYFAPTEGGNLWWVYYDHRRQRFFLQGCVE